MGIGVSAIIGIISQIPKLVEAVVDIVDDTKGVLSSKDAKMVEDALADMQKQNDAAYARVRAKLQAAAQKG